MAEDLPPPQPRSAALPRGALQRTGADLGATPRRHDKLALGDPLVSSSRILIVDDDPTDVLLLARILRQAGFRAVDGVTDSRHAVDRFRALDPDLVLLDLLMPGRDGFDVLADLRAIIPGGEFLPIVVLTGDGRPESRMRALASGATDFILKPFHAAEVELRVRSLVSLRLSYSDQKDYNEHLEAVIRERTRDIYEQGEFLRALLDCLDEGIVACDSRGELRLATDTVRRLGIDPRMLGPHADVTVDRIYSADHAVRLTAKQEPLTRADGGEIVTGLEMAVDDERGNVMVVANARPILDASGEKIGAVMALRDVTESHRIEKDFRHRAMHDPLTDLPNRTLFLDRLEQSIMKLGRAEDSIAVLFVDLDNFKVVNDTLGHAAGDEVLATTAERLRRCIRPGDTAARLGGDEFAVLCDGLAGDLTAEMIAARIRASIAAPLFHDGNALTTDVSIGIAVAQEPHVTASELLRCADVAMFRAKERGGARIELFEESLREQMLDQLAMIPGLRAAVSSGELLLHYQPTVVLETGLRSGAEALVRWQRPGVGLLGPASFVPLAEQSGIITVVDSWVLRTACQQLARWQQRADVDAAFTVSVNVSARRLAAPDLDREVREVLEQESADPSGLCLEITETALLRDMAHAATTLDELRAIGVRIAVDDFGTGYSSLAHLRRLPIDVVKIDQSFVSGLPGSPQDEAIVAAVIDLARALDLVTMAEGVETQRQATLLHELGCDQGQGFHFSRPLSVEEFDVGVSAAG